MESIPPEIILNIIRDLDNRSLVNLRRTCTYLSQVVLETKHYSVPMKYFSIAHLCYEFLNNNVKETGPGLKIFKKTFEIDMLKEMYEIENKLPRKTRVQHRPGCLVQHTTSYWSADMIDPSISAQKMDEYIVINLNPLQKTL